MIFEEMLKEERAAGFAKGRAEGVAQDGIPIEICGRICKEDKIRIYVGEYPI